MFRVPTRQRRASARLGLWTHWTSLPALTFLEIPAINNGRVLKSLKTRLKHDGTACPLLQEITGLPTAESELEGWSMTLVNADGMKGLRNRGGKKRKFESL